MVMLLAVGRLKAGPERDLFDRYWKRAEPLAKSLGFGALHTVELRENQADTGDQRKVAEGALLLERLKDGAVLIVLDERGKSISTPQFSKRLADWRDAGRSVALVVGGPDGLDEAVRQRADMVIGFGAMTMPHQLVRVLAAEQVYRVMTMLSGHPYHRA